MNVSVTKCILLWLLLCQAGMSMVHRDCPNTFHLDKEEVRMDVSPGLAMVEHSLKITNFKESVRYLLDYEFPVDCLITDVRFKMDGEAIAFEFREVEYEQRPEGWTPIRGNRLICPLEIQENRRHHLELSYKMHVKQETDPEPVFTYSIVPAFGILGYIGEATYKVNLPEEGFSMDDLIEAGAPFFRLEEKVISGGTSNFHVQDVPSVAITFAAEKNYPTLSRQVDAIVDHKGEAFFQAMCEWDDTAPIFFQFVDNDPNNRYGWIGWEQEQWDQHYKDSAPQLIIRELKNRWMLLPRERQLRKLDQLANWFTVKQMVYETEDYCINEEWVDYCYSPRTQPAYEGLKRMYPYSYTEGDEERSYFSGSLSSASSISFPITLANFLMTISPFERLLFVEETKQKFDRTQKERAERFQSKEAE